MLGDLFWSGLPLTRISGETRELWLERLELYGTARGQNNFEDLFSSGVPSVSGVGGSGGGSGNGGGGGWRLESFRGIRRRLTGVWHRVGSEQL